MLKRPNCIASAKAQL